MPLLLSFALSSSLATAADAAREKSKAKQTRRFGKDRKGPSIPLGEGYAGATARAQAEADDAANAAGVALPRPGRVAKLDFGRVPEGNFSMSAEDGGENRIYAALGSGKNTYRLEAVHDRDGSLFLSSLSQSKGRSVKWLVRDTRATASSAFPMASMISKLVDARPATRRISFAIPEGAADGLAGHPTYVALANLGFSEVVAAKHDWGTLEITVERPAGGAAIAPH